MALIWMDGFDHYSDSNLNSQSLDALMPQLWEYVSGTQVIVTSPMPVLGGRGLRSRARVGTNNNVAYALKLPKTYGVGVKVGIGFHWYTEVTTLGLDRGGFVAIGDPRTTADRYWVGYDPDGRVHVGRGNIATGNSHGSSDPGVILRNVLYHVEVQFFIHATEGTAVVRVDGVTVLTLTGLDTSVNTSGFLSIRPSGNTNTGANEFCYMDNLFIYDDQDGGIVDWLGPSIVSTQFPTTDVAPQDWVRSTGDDAHALLGNVPPSPETDYITAFDVDDEAVFGFAPLPSNVIGVRGTLLIAKGRSSNPVPVTVELNGADGMLFTLNNSAQYNLLGLNPDGDVPWTPSAINALQATLRRST